MNLASIIQLNAANLGDKPAIAYRDSTISYRELWPAVAGLARQLSDAGISARDRVGLSMADHPIHLMAHYAVACLGAVIVPIDHRWTEQEKQTAVDAFKVKLVAADSPIDQLETIILDPRTAESASPVDSDCQDLLISMSSGSTGKPKGAIVTHQQLYQRFVSQWVAIGLNANDCFAVLTPLFFGAGRSFAMSTLAAGGTVRLAPPPLQPEEIVSVLREAAVTATFLPPTLLRRLLPLAGPTPLLPDLKHLLVSGEPLHAAEALLVRENICPNLVGYYASSEGGGISVLRSDEFAEHAVTVGKPTFRTEVQIVDEHDQPLPNGQVGRLRYRGPGVATRFLDSDGNEQSAAEQGWFYPGDLAERLDTGHIALRGRDKEVIIRAGVNIYPAEIETTLMQYDSVNEVAVIGRDDPKRGQIIVAYIATDKPIETDAIEQFCRKNLAPYKVPAEFIQMESLPKAGSGKVNKRELGG